MVYLFIWSSVVSFVGSLQPGVINLNTFRIATNYGREQALLFCFGAVLSEIVFASVAVTLFQFVSVTKEFNVILTSIGIIVFAVLGIQLILKKAEGIDKELTISNKSAFFKSITLSLLNPGLLFFWLATTGIAIGSGYQLHDNIFNILSFVLGAGFGALILLLLVVFISERIKRNVNKLNINLLNKITGAIFLLLAGIGVIKLFL